MRAISMCLDEVNFSCTASVYKHSYMIEPQDVDQLVDLGPALVVVRMNFTKLADIPRSQTNLSFPEFRQIMIRGSR